MGSSDFGRKLVDWYTQHKRDLPWRKTKDPYHIWLSEIILQQTRVAQGLPYYERFTRLFPDVHALAAAPEDAVLKAWEGLGYYSRARNLHKSAKMVSGEMQGRFPSDYRGLLDLPGVGPYTAAAIASICYSEPEPVVDGNVNRFISRFLGIQEYIDSSAGRNALLSFLRPQIESNAEPGEFNQGLMEFGARHCSPKEPHCDSCVFAQGCMALRQDLVQTLPLKKAKTKVRDRYFDYHMLLHEGDTYICQRQAKGIWQGLYEFLLEERDGPDAPLRSITEGRAFLPEHQAAYKHVLSHQRIHARFLVYRVDRAPEDRAAQRIPLSSLDDYAMARISTRFLEENISTIDRLAG